MFHVTFFAIKDSFVKASVMISVGKSQIDSPLWNKIHDQQFA